MSQQHLQDQILAALRITLASAATDAGANVRVEPVDEIPAANCPAIDIEAGNETVEYTDLRRKTQRRDFDVEVRAIVASNTNYREAAGRLLAQIEAALRPAGGAPTFLDALVPDGIRLLGSQPDRDGNAARVTYVLRTLWRCRYFTTEGAAQAPTTP